MFRAVLSCWRLWFFGFLALAIGLSATTARAAEPRGRRLHGHFGYFGEFAFHPGAFGGIQYSLVGNHRAELLATGNLAAYVHWRNHVGLMLWPELGGRVRLGRRAALELLGGVGYLHTFLAAPVYVVDDGRVRKVTDPGRPGVMPTGSIGVGVTFRRVTPFARVQAFGQYPFNQHTLLHLALLVGVRL